MMILSSVNSCIPLLQKTNFREPLRELPRDEIESMNLKYYNPEIHRAAFILPEFARKVRRSLLFSILCSFLCISKEN